MKKILMTIFALFVMTATLVACAPAVETVDIGIVLLCAAAESPCTVTLVHRTGVTCHMGELYSVTPSMRTLLQR